MTSVGLDGCSKGWVAVWLNGDDRGLTFFDHITDLLTFPHDLAMIDMPIGLRDAGNRLCDEQARRLLRKHGSRVFTGARRGIWEFASRIDAHRHFRARGDPGVSCQLWCLRSKIREVDDMMTPERQRTLRETHPELVFLRLNGNRALPSKKTADGRKIRRDLLYLEGFGEIDGWLERRRLGTGAKPDDVLDACACAIAARDRKHRLPEANPPVDAKGLAMEIWY